MPFLDVTATCQMLLLLLVLAHFLWLHVHVKRPVVWVKRNPLWNKGFIPFIHSASLINCNHSGDHCVTFQFTQEMHNNDTGISVSWCRGTSAGLWGALQLFPPCPQSLCFSLPSHSLSSFCSVTLSLLTLPLPLSPSNALSHHCFSLCPPPPPTPSLLKFFSTHYSISFFGGHPFSLLHALFFSVPYAHCCCESDAFCSGFSICTEASSTFPSILNELYTHYQQGISGLTFFLLHLFIMHCISILQQDIISMVIHTGALSWEK